MTHKRTPYTQTVPQRLKVSTVYSGPADLVGREAVRVLPAVTERAWPPGRQSTQAPRLPRSAR